MFFIIIWVIITTICICSAIFDKSMFNDASDKFIVSFAMPVMFGLMIVVVYTVAALTIAPKEIVPMQDNIVSLVNLQQTEGSFVLGTGSIEGVEYYFYMCKYDNGSFERKKINVSRTLVYETNQTKPMITCNSKRIKKNFFFYPTYISTYDFKIYVPVGTIIKEFRIQ